MPSTWRGTDREFMYLGTILMFLATPLTLESFWAFFVFLPVPALIILRIRNEEEVLVRELPGYAEYRQKTRYRLVHGVRGWSE